MSDLTPGFMVLHGNRMEDLRDVLLDWLAQHPLPPLSPEVMLVQSNDMKQSLAAQQRARRLTFTAVSIHAPMARALVGKSVDDDLVVAGVEYTVLAVHYGQEGTG